MALDHPLSRMIIDAAYGRFPPHDSALSVLPPLQGVAAYVVAFSGHNVIATDLAEDEVRGHLPSDDPGAPMNPGSLPGLAGVWERATTHPTLF